MKTGKSIYLFLCILFMTGFFQNGFAEQSSAKLIVNTIKNDSYKFCVFRGKKQRISEKINKYLQIETFNGLIKKKKIPVIEGVSELSYSVESNKSILSVGVYTEYCSAYCSYNSMYYNFDLKTGDIFFIEDLFTKDGLDKLKEDLIKEREKKIKKEIAANRKNFSKKEGDNDSLKEQYELYQRCIESNRSKSMHYFKDFYIKDGVVYFLRERCSPHALRAIDEVGDFLNKRSFKELSPYLSNFGRYILLNGNYTELPYIFQKILTGEVAGKYPVTMLLREEKGKLYGGYLYDKFGKIIKLRGKITGKGRFYLEELDKERKVSATINLRLKGKKLKGSWKNRSNGKTLTIVLEK